MKRLAAVLASVALCGCLGGQGTPPATYFVLSDGGAASPPAASAPVPKNLVVASGVDDAFYDAESLVYSREAGSRAYYQFAAWTDRPSRRLAAMVERRLEARGRFASVSSITAGVNADLLLNVNVVELYHDLTVNPAVARVQLIGEMVDWKTRVLVGRRSFTVAVPVARADAKAAVDSINRGVTLILDELVPWAEDAAANMATRTR